MANIDFALVKKVVIPEGDVQRISDGTDIIWEKKADLEVTFTGGWYRTTPSASGTSRIEVNIGAVQNAFGQYPYYRVVLKGTTYNSTSVSGSGTYTNQFNLQIANSAGSGRYDIFGTSSNATPVNVTYNTGVSVVIADTDTGWKNRTTNMTKNSYVYFGGYTYNILPNSGLGVLPDRVNLLNGCSFTFMFANYPY